MTIPYSTRCTECLHHDSLDYRSRSVTAEVMYACSTCAGQLADACRATVKVLGHFVWSLSGALNCRGVACCAVSCAV
jgi:hypothetical protein